jgi:capsule polysaccharide export protein KpsE/RkpR
VAVDDMLEEITDSVEGLYGLTILSYRANNSRRYNNFMCDQPELFRNE